MIKKLNNNYPLNAYIRGVIVPLPTFHNIKVVSGSNTMRIQKDKFDLHSLTSDYIDDKEFCLYNDNTSLLWKGTAEIKKLSDITYDEMAMLMPEPEHTLSLNAIRQDDLVKKFKKWIRLATPVVSLTPEFPNLMGMTYGFKAERLPNYFISVTHIDPFVVFIKQES